MQRTKVKKFQQQITRLSIRMAVGQIAARRQCDNDSDCQIYYSVLPSSVTLVCDARSKKGFGPETKLMSHTEICLLERDSCDEPRKGGEKAEAAASFFKGEGGWRTCEGITVECTRQKVAAAAVLAFGRVTVFCLVFRVVR